MKGKQVTDFQWRLRAALEEVPRGWVITYGELARRLACGSARAVGQALRANTSAPQVPCHRVVRSDRTLGGYQGATTGERLERKRRLLEEEGVRFEPDGRVARGCVLGTESGEVRPGERE